MDEYRSSVLAKLQAIAGADAPETLIQGTTEWRARVLALLGEITEGAIPEKIAEDVSSWLEENITQPTEPAIDTSLSVSGAAADAKATGDAINAKSGLSNEAKQSLLTLFDNIAYTINNGYTLVNDFMLKLFPNQEYPMENGTHTFSSNNRVLTITNGNHIHFENPGATSSITPAGGYLDLNTVSQNDTSGTATSNINKTTSIFTIPANTNVTFKVFNISYEKLNDEAFFNIGLRQNSTSKWTVGNNASNTETTHEFSFDTDTSITCVFMYIRSPFRTFDCDIAMFVDGERWI